MKYWIKISCIMFVYGFVKEISPIYPHALHDNLTLKGFSLDQINYEILPLKTYSQLICLIVVCLITDVCRYKPVIILHGLCGVAATSCTLWGKTLFQMQMFSCFLGATYATEVAYLTYSYAVVQKRHYRHVTSVTIVAVLAGRLVSDLLSQASVSVKIMDFKQMHYVTLASWISATIWSLFIPAVSKSRQIPKEDAASTSNSSRSGEDPESMVVESEVDKSSLGQRICDAFLIMKTHFSQCFHNRVVFKWIVWLIFTTAGFIQVQSYAQILWAVVIHEEGNKYNYNGAADAICILASCLSALIAGLVKVDWKFKAELALTTDTLMLAFSVLVASQARHILTCYACYIIIGCGFFFMFVTAIGETVKHIEIYSYALVLGVIGLFSLAVQTLITCAFTSKWISLELEPRQQYLAYGLYLILVATVYIVIGLVHWFKVAEHAYSRAF